jgi:hypothetical protein
VLERSFRNRQRHFAKILWSDIRFQDLGQISLALWHDCLINIFRITNKHLSFFCTFTAEFVERNVENMLSSIQNKTGQFHKTHHMSSSHDLVIGMLCCFFIVCAPSVGFVHRSAFMPCKVWLASNVWHRWVHFKYLPRNTTGHCLISCNVKPIKAIAMK